MDHPDAGSNECASVAASVLLRYPLNTRGCFRLLSPRVVSLFHIIFTTPTSPSIGGLLARLNRNRVSSMNASRSIEPTLLRFELFDPSSTVLPSPTRSYSRHPHTGRLHPLAQNKEEKATGDACLHQGGDRQGGWVANDRRSTPRDCV